jgi:hypothetical protein
MYSRGMPMEAKADDLIEFVAWLAQKGVKVLHGPSISVTADVFPRRLVDRRWIRESKA